MKLLNTFALIGNYLLAVIYIATLFATEFRDISIGYLVGELLAVSIPIVTLVFLHKSRGLIKEPKQGETSQKKAKTVNKRK